LAGKFFDRQHIEAHRALFHVPLHQKPPRRAANQMLFLRRRTHLGSSRAVRVRTSTNISVSPIVADQVNLAFTSRGT
jgi:hypothetical protein